MRLSLPLIPAILAIIASRSVLAANPLLPVFGDQNPIFKEDDSKPEKGTFPKLNPCSYPWRTRKHQPGIDPSWPFEEAPVELPLGHTMDQGAEKTFMNQVICNYAPIGPNKDYCANPYIGPRAPPPDDSIPGNFDLWCYDPPVAGDDARDRQVVYSDDARNVARRRLVAMSVDLAIDAWDCDHTAPRSAEGMAHVRGGVVDNSETGNGGGNYTYLWRVTSCDPGSEMRRQGVSPSDWPTVFGYELDQFENRLEHKYCEWGRMWWEGRHKMIERIPLVDGELDPGYKPFDVYDCPRWDCLGGTCPDYQCEFLQGFRDPGKARHLWLDYNRDWHTCKEWDPFRVYPEDLHWVEPDRGGDLAFVDDDDDDDDDDGGMEVPEDEFQPVGDGLVAPDSGLYDLDLEHPASWYARLPGARDEYKPIPMGVADPDTWEAIQNGEPYDVEFVIVQEQDS